MAVTHHDGIDAVTTFRIGGVDVNRTAAQMNKLAQGVASAYFLARGNTIATANKAVNTGLTAIVDFAVVARASTGTQINNARIVSGRATNATLTVYRWKATSAGTSTLIAATTAGTVEWLAVGT